jgi:hypothetical protein
MDRVMEAVVENSYGRVSLSWEIDVQPTLYIPYDYPADSAFAYHQNPTSDYLSKKGINVDTDYHTVIVSTHSAGQLLTAKSMCTPECFQITSWSAWASVYL